MVATYGSSDPECGYMLFLDCHLKENTTFRWKLNFGEQWSRWHLDATLLCLFFPFAHPVMILMTNTWYLGRVPRKGQTAYIHPSVRDWSSECAEQVSQPQRLRTRPWTWCIPKGCSTEGHQLFGYPLMSPHQHCLWLSFQKLTVLT